LDFIVGDVSNGLDLSNSHGSFVVVVGTWLLNYASNLKEMEGMWRSVVANLKPGGLFVGLTIPPPLGSRHELDRAFRDDWAPFGTDGHVTDNADEGFVVHIRLGMPGAEKSVEFDNYYLQNEVFESSCRNAGMGGGLEWMPLVLDRLKEKFPFGYWNRLVLNPHFRICQARR
jgi:hypothetical protein